MKVLSIVRQLPGNVPVVSSVIEVPEDIDSEDSWSDYEVASAKTIFCVLMPEFVNATWSGFINTVE